MATYGEVNTHQDAIDATLAGSIQMWTRARNSLKDAWVQLNGLPTQYADMISTVNGYTPTGAVETFAKDRLSKQTTEFTAFKSELEDAMDALGITYP